MTTTTVCFRPVVRAQCFQTYQQAQAARDEEDLKEQLAHTRQIYEQAPVPRCSRAPPLETSDGQFPLVQRNTIPPTCRLRSTMPAVAPLQKKGKGIEMDSYFNG